MKSWTKIALLASLFLFSTGCVRFHVLIKMQDSGAGKLFLRCLLSESLDDGKNTKINKEQLENFTKLLGDGVRFVETSKVSEKGWKGFTIQYEFDDINELRLPVHELSEIKDGTNEKEGSSSTLSFSESGPWRFRYKPGDVNELVAFHEKQTKPENTDDPFAEAGVELPDAPNAQLSSQLAVGFLKPMLQKARFTVTVQVDGDIVETNAPSKLRSNSVHLFDADLKKFADSKQFEEVILGEWTMERAIREKVDGIHGLPSDKEIIVKFR